MEVRCDKCQARYRVDDARIGPQGLTMRCGKCQNTFKVTRPAAGAAPAPAAAKPAPKPLTPPEPEAPDGATQMLYVKPPAAATRPPAVATRPVPPRPAAAQVKPAAAPADETAGRTMMFQTGNVKSPPASKTAPQMEPEKGMATLVQAAPPKHFDEKPPGDAEAGATMVFAPPTAAKPPAGAKPQPKTPAAAAPAPAGDEGSGATMMFGTAPLAKDANTPATAVRPPTADDPGPRVSAEEFSPSEQGSEPEAEPGPEPEHTAGPDGTQEAAPLTPVDTEAPEASPSAGRFDKAPPKGLLIGVGAGLLVLLIALAGVVAWKKMSSRPPPPAAFDSMNAALADADKDTLASLGSAEGKAREALDEAGPKAKFPEGVAMFARIEVQLADAFNDQAQRLSDLSAKETDDKKKADEDAKAAQLVEQAKAKLKTAFDTLAPALKADRNSVDLQLAFADYYRAQRSGSNMGKFLKAAQANKADDPRISFIQGAFAAQADEGFEAAVPKLKEAIAATPQSARAHYRLALVYLAMKDETSASAELKTTLQISPQHERAKAALDGIEHK